MEFECFVDDGNGEGDGDEEKKEVAVHTERQGMEEWYPCEYVVGE